MDLNDTFTRLCNLQVYLLFLDFKLTPPGYVILLNITIHKVEEQWSLPVTAGKVSS